MTDQDGRFAITREKYLSSLDPRLSDAVCAVIDDLIEWSHESSLIDEFSDGERGPAFTPKVSRPDKECRTFYIQADGWVVIPIRWMNDRLPFSDHSKAQELVSRIEEIPGSIVTEKANDGFPKFPVASLISSTHFSKFIETLEWIIEEIRSTDGTPVERQIWVYGNPDKSDLGFESPAHLTQYIKEGVFSTESGRYRHTLIRNADIIILSRDGMAFGHFEIEARIKPTEFDITEYPPVKSVYLVRKSVLYNRRVRLTEIRITGIQFGRKITEVVFNELLMRAEGGQEFRNVPPIPEEIQTSTRYFEGAVTTITVNSYERNSEARQKCLQHHGYSCAVCGFSMADLYGELGKTVIHVHHLREISSIGKEYEVDPINDLRPVCPNCHAVLHTELPVMPIEKLRKLLSERKPIQWPAQLH